MINFSNPEISQIMSKDSNHYCVDCLSENPVFTSINNAVFLCGSCANKHRTLGQNISIVKSLMNDQFSPDEINLLRIGGNFRFNNLMNEYCVSNSQNKEFKYHLKITDYYRQLLLAELNRINNPNEFEQMVKNKPSPEIGLQIMENVTFESLNQAKNQSQSEFAKDASNIMEKITGFFSYVGNAINNTANQYGITEKINNIKSKISEEAKTFGENHPIIQNAASSTVDTIITTKNYVGEGLNKIVQSTPVQNLSKQINDTCHGVINSETVKNLSQKADVQYASLKEKIIGKFGNGNNQQELLLNNDINQTF